MKLDSEKKFDLITIGSDPEFVVMINGKIRSAITFFQSLAQHRGEFEGACDECGEEGGGNCDSCMTSGEDGTGYMGVDVGEAGNIGWDGCSSTGEMRPRHGRSPFNHVENIATLLRFVHSKNKLVKFAAVNKGGGPRENVVPTGGHIHFGLPRNTLTCGNDFLRMFSTLMLPIVFADGARDYAVRRISGQATTDDSNFRIGSYGGLTDWRSEGRSGNVVYEFRSLTSSWTSTKELAYTTLATAGAVFEGLLTLRDTDNEAYRKLEKSLSPYSKTLTSLQRLALLDEDNVLFTGFSRRIRKEMRKLPTYAKWQEEIEHALDMRWQRQQIKKGASDIIEGWDMRSNKRIPLYTLQKGIRVSEAALEECRDAYMPSYSEEVHVDDFALEIAKAGKVLGWSLKKTIHLYGIRAGANAYILMNANREGAVIKRGEGRITGDNLETAARIASGVSDSPTRLVGEKRKILAIGIPYELREKIDTKGFLELVWRADNDLITFTADLTSLITPEVKKEEANSPVEQPVCAE